MSRSLEAQQAFPADPGSTFLMLSDPGFLEDVLSTSGGTDIEASATPDGAGGMVLVLDRALPAAVPSYAKAIVGERIVVREVRRWGPADDAGQRTGSFDATFDGAPVSISGTLALVADSDGTHVDIAGSISARIPLVGGKVEELARDQLLRFVDHEARVGLRWLERA